MNANSGQYSKFIVSVLGTVTSALTTYYPSTAHWVPVVTEALTALAVYLIPNMPKAVQPPARGSASPPVV